MAGGSARGFGARVKTAAESRGSSARSMPAASLSSRIESTATVPSGTEAAERRDAGRVVRAVEDRQRVVVDDLQAPGDARTRRDRGHARRVERAAERAPRRRRARRRSCRAGSRAGRPRAPRRSRRARAERGGAHDRRARRAGERDDLRARRRRARASRPGRTTASFSPAMSAIVGPSQRVCSRPTLVSTTTGAPSTLVASQRPPRPASTTATSTSRRASSENAAAVSSSNWVTRSPPVSVRSTLAAAAAARWIAAPKSRAETSASPIRIRSANDVRCGER